ncbi:uncharacterized protein LOC133784955 [Humulus lupulus]|uniref:uncharacterized protein LOC133784955 n=1 Tax=Humulus lupulus TaxID=3486 RepID=UPI002B41502F|nr:uncharacterized protein LOC133784955 [Humulus lupulus]
MAEALPVSSSGPPAQSSVSQPPFASSSPGIPSSPSIVPSSLFRGTRVKSVAHKKKSSRLSAQASRRVTRASINLGSSSSPPQPTSDPVPSPPPRNKSKVSSGPPSGPPHSKSSSAGGESDPNSAYFFVSRFAEKRFKDFVSFRRLHVETSVVLEDFPRLLALLESRHWVNTVSGLVMPSQNLVREFYSNIEKSLLDAQHPNRFTIFCRGKRVSFAPSTIRALLNIPLVTDAIYNAEYAPDLNQVGRELTGQSDFCWNEVSNDFPTPSLTSFYRVLLKVALTNWIPNSHTSTVTADIGRFLYAVGTGVTIDLSVLIFDRVYQAFLTKSRRLFLPFPCLVHKVTLAAHPKFTSQDVFLPLPVLDKSFQPLSSKPVPPPQPLKYPLLKGLPPASWKYKLFELLYSQQSQLDSLQSSLLQSQQRSKAFERRVLAQLAGLRQVVQTFSPSVVQGAGSVPQSAHSPANSQGELSPTASDKAPGPV